jgi:nickel superoxide dismutase
MDAMNSLARKLLANVDRLAHFDEVYAHCDYPCGIYDPFDAQIAAHTVIRMDDLIGQLKHPEGHQDQKEAIEYHHSMIRATEIKEKYAEACKHELRVLWGDYFKPEHAQANPKLHELFFTAMKQASKAKQTTDVKQAEALLDTVMQIAEAFWKTKNIETKRVEAPYPTKRQIVVPKLY